MGPVHEGLLQFLRSGPVVAFFDQGPEGTVAALLIEELLCPASFKGAALGLHGCEVLGVGVGRGISMVDVDGLLAEVVHGLRHGHQGVVVPAQLGLGLVHDLVEVVVLER